MLNYASKISLYPAPVRLGIFIIFLVLIWLPLAIPIYLVFKDDPNLVTILTMGLLFLEFLILIKFWGQNIYRESKSIERYGLIWTKNNGICFLKGWAIGFWFCLGLFILEGLFGWVNFIQPSETLFKVIIEGFLSALGISLAEELVFRGWLVDELERDYSLEIVTFASAIVFAIAHFLKPLAEIIRTFPTFPALVLLGLILIWAKRSHRNNLGICIGIHGGLVWGYYILNVGQLVEYSGNISPLITGIDGNPIAGLMGILFLGILAFWMRTKAMSIENQS
ncbi:MAG: CPBP family intramembrane metalloprotease [Prochloraceae cyanobacterium]|nr:CPBP family intramembrane metalloprotease [Prochloraceae cyanobacterium]